MMKTMRIAMALLLAILGVAASADAGQRCWPQRSACGAQPFCGWPQAGQPLPGQPGFPAEENVAAALQNDEDFGGEGVVDDSVVEDGDELLIDEDAAPATSGEGTFTMAAFRQIPLDLVGVAIAVAALLIVLSRRRDSVIVVK